MAEGTGLEPYSPCQGLVRGQGGGEDVQACVNLAIHPPVAHLPDKILAHPISAPGATPFPVALAAEESSGNPPIAGLLGRELPSASEVDLLDEPDTVERNAEKSCRIACGVDPIEGILVRVEGNGAIGLVRLRGLLPH